jgi:hypothetical protein
MTTATATKTVTETVINDTTTDLATIERKALDRLAKSDAKSDLDAFVRGARRSLMLVDCSGSMDSYIVKTGERRIDALRKVVATIRETQNVPVAAFGTDYGDVVVVDTIPEPCGSTPVHSAIDFGKAQGATHLVLVTDGYPDSQDAAFAAAARFGHPIDVFYVGDGRDSGAAFAQELARRTGGTCSINDMSAPKELAGKVVLMLGDGQ